MQVVQGLVGRPSATFGGGRRAGAVGSGWHRVCRVSTALKVICSRCQQEGKPSLLVTIDIPGDDREIHGLCWTHRLRLLAKSTDSTPSREPGER